MKPKKKFPHPETIFKGGYEMFKRERVPLFEEWGWVAHHPQFIFDKDNYARIMFDMFTEIHHSGASDDPEDPWYPYLQDFLRLRAAGRFDPEGRLGMNLKQGIDEELQARAAKGDRRAQEELARRKAAAKADKEAQRAQAKAEKEAADPRLKTGMAVPEGSLF